MSDRTRALGIRSDVIIPMVSRDRLVGTISLASCRPEVYQASDLEFLQPLADQMAVAVDNARLFRDLTRAYQKISNLNLELRERSLELERANQLQASQYRQLAEASRQTEAANRAKSAFLANMSHELRTPLNSIIGMSDILLEKYFGDINPRQEEYLRDIHESGHHLLSLINDVLDLSKIEAGHSPLERTEIDLRLLLENSLAIVRERAHRQGINPLLPGPGRPPLDRGGRPEGQTGDLQPPLQRRQVHPRRGKGGDRGQGSRCGGWAVGGGLRLGHRHRHRPGGSGEGLRRVRPGGVFSEQTV